MRFSSEGWRECWFSDVNRETDINMRSVFSFSPLRPVYSQSVCFECTMHKNKSAPRPVSVEQDTTMDLFLVLMLICTSK